MSQNAKIDQADFFGIPREELAELTLLKLDYCLFFLLLSPPHSWVGYSIGTPSPFLGPSKASAETLWHA